MADFSLTDLSRLNRAISQGAMSVRFEDREVRFHSLSDMLKLRELMRRELGLSTTAGNRKFLSCSKGLDGE